MFRVLSLRYFPEQRGNLVLKPSRAERAKLGTSVNARLPWMGIIFKKTFQRPWKLIAKHFEIAPVIFSQSINNLGRNMCEILNEFAGRS